MSEPHWQTVAADQARKLIPNKAYQSLAVLMVTGTERAADYLVQAPVLVVAASCGRADHSRAATNYILSMFVERCKKGPKLRDLMAEYRVAYGFRALKGSVLCPSRALAILALSADRGIHPSALAQAIPTSSRNQTRWLRTVMRWGEYMDSRNRAFSLGLDWVALQSGAALKVGNVEVTDIADFYRADPACFNPKWTFEQAKAATDRWHRRLGKEQNEAAFFKYHGLGFSEPIDYSPFPLAATVDGYDFVALDSGEELFAEGCAMHHCVGTYSSDVIGGRSRIFSIRKGERRIATVEYQPNGRFIAVVQIKGPCNTAPVVVVRQAAYAFKDAVIASLEKARAA